MNIIILIGRVGKNPEIREVGESQVATFSLATSKRGFTTKNGKEIPDSTQWHNIVAWRGLATLCEGYVHTGDRLCVKGEIVYRNYEKDGIKHYVTDVVADTIELLSSKQEKQDEKSEVEHLGRKDNFPF